MTSKYQFYSDLADRQTRQVTGSMKSWTDFLSAAGRLYKYPFEEQLMIHVQRPDAVACASFDLWNQPMNRYIKGGSKGIALLDNTSGKPRLKYVFDVADTRDGRHNPYRPYIWELKPEHEALVMEALQESYNPDDYMGYETDNSRVMQGNHLGDYLYNLAQSLSARYYEDNKRDIEYLVGGSFLDGYDEYSTGAAFREALAVSTAYTLMSRCGIDPAEYISNEDFQPVFDFNTPKSVYALGEAVSTVSEEVLREIEITVKKYEREKSAERGENHERNHLLAKRGLSNTRHNDTRTDRIVGQVRHDAEALSEPTPQNIIYDIRLGGNAVSPLLGDRVDGERAVRTDDERIDGENQSDNAGQSHRPDRLDGAHEQLESPSGGSHTGRVDLQLNNQTENNPQTETPPISDGVSASGDIIMESPAFDSPEPVVQLSFFPTEKEQIENIQATEQAIIANKPVMITQADIDMAIINWNGDNDSKIRVFEYMRENARARETANVLKREYGGNMDVFTITKEAVEPVTLPWAKVQRRIAQLMDEGKFITPEEPARHGQQHDNVADNAEQEAIEHPATPTDISINRTIISTFANKDTLHYATDANGALYISNGFHIMKSAEQDIDRITAQINSRRQNNPITPKMNERILDYVNSTKGSFELSQKPYELGVDKQIAYVYADNKQYFQYDKRLVDIFQLPGSRMFVDDNSNYDINNHHLIIKDSNNGVIGVVFPIRVVESLYERLADVLPLEIPYKNEMERARENPTNDPYIGKEFFDGREIHFISSIKNIDGVDMYTVPTIENGSLSRSAGLIKISDMDSQIARWETSRIDMEKQRAIWESTAREEAAAKAEYENTNGFADDLPPMQKAKVLKALNDSFPTKDYGRLSVKQFIEAAIKDGKTLEVEQFVKRKYQDMDASEYLHTFSGFTRSDMWSKYRAALTNPEAEDGENAIWLKENHPFLYFKLFHDMSVLPSNYLNIEYHLRVDDRSHYPISKTAHDYGKYLIDNGIFIRQGIAEIGVEPLNGSQMWQEYQTLAMEYRDKILFVQSGDSYEVLGSDALTVAKFLKINQLIRYEELPERIPICSVPRFFMDEYTDLLTRNGFGVVVRDTIGTIVLHEAIGQNIPEHTPAVTPEIISNAEQSTMSAEERQEQSDFTKTPIYYSPEKHIPYREGDIVASLSVKAVIIAVDDEYIHYNFVDNPEATTPKMERKRFEELLDTDAYRTILPGAEQATITETPPTLEELIFAELENRGFITSDELIADGISAYHDFMERQGFKGDDDCQEIAEFIESEFLLTHEDEMERYGIDEQAEQAESEQAEITRTPPINFRITDDRLGEGGAKTKYGFNVAAIRTLQTIEEEKRLATPEEQEILSRYVGWGGISQAFDKDNASWAKEYAELKTLLSPDEYDSARASVLNAHYTSPTVIKAMYETLARMGFKDGNLLEPSCGVGNFLGLLPDSMKNSKMYGVELDSITGRIAKQLYQQSDIKVMGFEKTETPDAFFDAAIGNVPFGSYKIMDKKYDKNNFFIHDYFFAKALDQVRPGGIIAFVTSKGTLDKANPEVRKYLAQRAELLGAVRLPNDAFLKNAGTEVTSDIIFLQKRDRQIDILPEWVHLGQTEDGIPINSYFADNPHMVLGTMAYDKRLYGNNTETTCNPIEGADLAEQLSTALSHIQGEIPEPELDDLADDMAVRTSIAADPNVRNFSYALVSAGFSEDEGRIIAKALGEGDVYFRENSRMYPVDMPAATLERVKGMIALRDATHQLIQCQMDDYPDHYIRKMQETLNEMYDNFTKKHGLINSSANSKAFSVDSSYYLLCSLEVLDEDGNLERKSDMFTKRTIKQNTVVTSVDTSSEALAVSIGQKARVDIDYMASLTGFTPEKIMQDLEGVIFCDVGNPNRSLPDFDPETMKIYSKFPLVTADEYLSGNVRQKLSKAKAFQDAVGDTFHGINVALNVKMLEQAQPKEIEAGDIAVRLGATWVDKKYVQQFMYELLRTPYYLQDNIVVNYSEHTGEWNITGKTGTNRSDVLANVTYGTERMNAYKIIEETLNLRDARVYDIDIVDGKETRVLNEKQTTLATQRQDAIKQAFKDWVFSDPKRRQHLVTLYNERFNSTRPREYDGSHIQFSGISPVINLKPHQTAAIARILYGGNTLLAHEVGAGKTFEMVGAAMESKRLGLCNKSLMVVPNHLTEQMAGEFLRLYPSANILVATKKDFETKNRKKFCAKIATGDYDAVIIGHSQFEKIPLSKERQERLINEQIDEIVEGIDALKREHGDRFSIKQMEKTKKNLESRLEKLNNDSRKDSVVTFEQLGIDRLFVDESHSYKNLFMYTKMRNVAGLSTSEAQKSSDMFMKCRYMDELTGGKGCIFATGTPMYTLQQ